jgi:hypothetical protein
MPEDTLDCRVLMAKALAKTIDEKETKALICCLELEHDLVFECGVTPDKFHIMITSCAEVALAAILSIGSSPKKPE